MSVSVSVYVLPLSLTIYTCVFKSPLLIGSAKQCDDISAWLQKKNLWGSFLPLNGLLNHSHYQMTENPLAVSSKTIKE